MNQRRSRRKRQRSIQRGAHRALWAIVAIVFLGASLAFASMFASTLARTPKLQLGTPGDGTTSPTQGGEGEPSTDKRYVVVWLTQYGFEPQTTTIPAGNYVLMVRNVSGRSNVALTAHGLATAAPGQSKSDDMVPVPVPDVPIALGSGRVFSRLFGFVPGRTLLTDPENPGWTCEINVAPT